MSPEETKERLRSILNSLSESHGSSVSDLANFLNSISDSALSQPTNEEQAKAIAFEALSQLHRFIASSSITEEVADALSFELPSVASRFGAVSDECSAVAVELIGRLVTMFNPRDMLSILCEALACSGDTVKFGSAYYVPIFSGISKVFTSIRRRHFEQVKSAVPIVLNVLKAVSLEAEDENEDLNELFKQAVSIANSCKQVSTELDDGVNEKLRALLGLYVLQIMALASFSYNCEILSYNSLVAQLSSFFPYCGLSYIGLITGDDVNTMNKIAVGESEDDFMSCFSYVNHGASLSVIMASKEDRVSVENELRKDPKKRWQAFGMLKHVLALTNLPWKFKKDAINMILCVTDENISSEYDDEAANCSDFVPSLFATLKAVQTVLMFTPDRELRRMAFDAFKKILADIPASERFEILKALIRNSDSPSMTAILLDIVRSELRRESCQINEIDRHKAFWNSSVLELVDMVLRPPKGGPPELPEQGESVLSALNLYRFLLITESTGKTNHTGALSKSNLRKSMDEWLLPLRTLVSGIMGENSSDHDQFAVDTVCAINPIELVLYRCIELVEENIKQLG